ncbi:uncharacterized protein LOC126655018 [Mercurialis annua]|uniref:uncharacterized protein LOC126655018 n=1 Tax=Mercurialis annua TaxID=3986 RepID=UPI00215E55E9|nr:uncharacterized protein LOC126655018 [Mercurialis annua]
MRNPSFQVGMQFGNFNQFKDMVRNYGIKNRYVMKLRPNTRGRCKAYCKKDCPFYIWASLMNKDKSTVQIKSGIFEHSCTKDHNIRHLSPKWIAETYMEQFRADPSWKLAGIIQAVKTNQEAKINTVRALRAKQIALLKINGDEKEQYGRLYDYKLELIRTHPGSTIMFKLNNIVFCGMYICLGPLKAGFKDGCRPVISIDRCWLKGIYGGQLLSAVGIDANDCIYPIAWDVVDKENKENWSWFLELLADDLDIGNSYGWAFMSDRKKGLIPALESLFPHAEHRYCVRHIHSNFKQTFKSKELKDALWKAARASHKVGFQAALKNIKELYPGAYAYLHGIKPEHWTRSHFRDLYKCDMLLNNLCESFNNVILEARTKGIITMNEMIRCQLMKRIQKKRDSMLKSNLVYCPKIMKKVEKSRQISWSYSIDWPGGDKYQVYGYDGQYEVDTKERTCACRRWELMGLPCFHVVAAIKHNNGNHENYISGCYRVSTYIKIYSHILNPINGKELWPKSDQSQIISPKPVNNRRGRKTMMRRKEADEVVNGSQKGLKQGIITDGRITRKGMKVTCSECGLVGHNKRSCKKQNTQATQATALTLIMTTSPDTTSPPIIKTTQMESNQSKTTSPPAMAEASQAGLARAIALTIPCEGTAATPIIPSPATLEATTAQEDEPLQMQTKSLEELHHLTIASFGSDNLFPGASLSTSQLTKSKSKASPTLKTTQISVKACVLGRKALTRDFTTPLHQAATKPPPAKKKKFWVPPGLGDSSSSRKL